MTVPDVAAPGGLVQAAAAFSARAHAGQVRKDGATPYASHPARVGRNPRTGESVLLPPSKTVRFKAAPELRAALSERGAP